MTDDLSIQLRERGIVLLRDVFRTDSLNRLKTAAERFFQAIGPERSLSEQYRYNRFSNSVLVTALMDFGCCSSEELWAPLSAPGLWQLFTEVMGTAWSCNREQSWVRKKLAPGRAAHSGYHLQGWHQDGAFMGADIRSLNVWLSLSHCGDDAPGLDVVARRLDQIVPTGTDGAYMDWNVGPGMVERVAQGSVTRPIFEAGDALIFDHMLLHRTAVDASMVRDRYAIESWFLAPSTYASMMGIGGGVVSAGVTPRDQLPMLY